MAEASAKDGMLSLACDSKLRGDAARWVVGGTKPRGDTDPADQAVSQQLGWTIWRNSTRLRVGLQSCCWGASAGFA